VAIITGAGSGIGRDTATLLADAGYAVSLAGRTLVTLQETAHAITHDHPDAAVEVIPTDVSTSVAVEALVRQTLKRWGRIDALANCAGSAPLGPLDKWTDQDIDDILAVNLKSVIYTTRAVWPTFNAQQSGAICNVSSMASIDPFTGFNLYAAAKAGVNLFTKATADEGKPFNITAAAIAPGAVETAMLRANFGPDLLPQAKTLDPLVVAGLIRDVLTGTRAVSPGETIVLPSP